MQKKLTIASNEKQHDCTKNKIKTTISQDALSWHLKNFKWITLGFRQFNYYNGTVVGDADEDDKKVFYVSTMKDPESERRNKILFCIGWEGKHFQFWCAHIVQKQTIFYVIVVAQREGIYNIIIYKSGYDTSLSMLSIFNACVRIVRMKNKSVIFI